MDSLPLLRREQSSFWRVINQTRFFFLSKQHVFSFYFEKELKGKYIVSVASMVFRATRNKSPNFFSKSPVHVCPAGWSGTALCALTRPPVRGLAAAVQPPSTPPPPSPFREGKTDWIPVLLRCHVPQGTQKLRDSLSTSLHGCTQSFSFRQFSAPLRLTQNVYDSFFPFFFLLSIVSMGEHLLL